MVLVASPAKRFFEEHRGFSSLTTEIHDLLLDSSQTRGNPTRRSSISHDGTPVVYSLKFSAEKQDAFRVIFETGGFDCDISVQIDHALSTLMLCLKKLGTPNGEIVRCWDIIQSTLPFGQANRNELVGGIWVGMEVDGDKLQMRAYVNLRNGSIDSRWERLDKVASYFQNSDCFARLRMSNALLCGLPEPMGICVAVSESGIDGLRLYTALPDPNLGDLMSWGDSLAPMASKAAKLFASRFVRDFGEFSRYSVSLGYDYAIHQNLISRDPVRHKMELSCECLPDDSRTSVPRWSQEIASELGLPRPAIDSFAEGCDRFNRSFEGFKSQYISLGVRDQVDHLTLYLQPNGLRTAHKEN